MNGLRHLLELWAASVDNTCTACGSLVTRERNALCVRCERTTTAVETEEGAAEHGLAEALRFMEHLASGGFG